MDAEKEIQQLKDEKLDKIVVESLDATALNRIDLSLETEATKELVKLINNIVNKLKSK